MTPASESEPKHLWEIDHPYYCNQGNYYSNDCHDHHKTWASFIAEYGGCDFDMNLVFRFDWHLGSEHELPPSEDPYYRDGKLLIFWLGQRKGIYRYSTVEVCRADEPAVIEFLKPRWEHMIKLWEGIS